MKAPAPSLKGIHQSLFAEEVSYRKPNPRFHPPTGLGRELGKVGEDVVV
jgi:hypothetical protein